MISSNFPSHLQIYQTAQHGRVSPVHGWLLEAMADLEVVSPGMLLAATKAGSRWRQAACLAIAHGLLEQPDAFLIRTNGQPSHGDRWPDILAEVAQTIRAMNAEDLLSAAVPEVPDGLRGAIAKLGYRQMLPQSYRDLVALLQSNDGVDRKRAQTLRQMAVLDSDILDAIQRADPVALFPESILRLRSHEAVDRLNGWLVTIRRLCTTATDDAIRQSLACGARGFRVQHWAHQWLEKADRLPSACAELEGDPDFIRIIPANSGEIGREFSNCISTHVMRLASGVWSAWVIRPFDLIVTLTKVSDGWLLTGVHGRGNLDVSHAHRGLVETKLREHGVHAFTAVEAPPIFGGLASSGLGGFDGEDFD